MRGRETAWQVNRVFLSAVLSLTVYFAMPRVVLGGTVTVKVETSGVLSIVGTNDPDTFSVNETAPGEVEVVPGGGTVLSSLGGCVVASGAAECSGVVGFFITLKDQDDGVLVNSSLPAEVIGGSGDDEIHGGAGNDELDGGNGVDILFGGAGDDTLSAGSGQDELYGGLGNDNLAGGTESDLVDGGDGNDTLNGNAGDDSLFGFAGSDTIGGDSGHDAIDGGDGEDTLNGNDGNDALFGGAGTDQISGGSGTNTIVHDPFRVGGCDVLRGNSERSHSRFANDLGGRRRNPGLYRPRR